MNDHIIYVVWMFFVVQGTDETAVRLLLGRDGVDINSRDKSFKKTSLIWAAKNGHEAVMRLLLERGY